jgi:hypothetical protein
VQVARANLDKKQLDFVLVDEKNPARTLDQLGEKVSVPQALSRKSSKTKTSKKKAKATKTKTKTKQAKRSKKR